MREPGTKGRSNYHIYEANELIVFFVPGCGESHPFGSTIGPLHGPLGSPANLETKRLSKQLDIRGEKKSNSKYAIGHMHGLMASA
jgi:hypothetical protein